MSLVVACVLCSMRDILSETRAARSLKRKGRGYSSTRELLFHGLVEQQQKPAPARASAKTHLTRLLILIKFIRLGQMDFYTSHCAWFMA